MFKSFLIYKILVHKKSGKYPKKSKKKSEKSEKSEKILFEDLKSVQPIWEWTTPRRLTSNQRIIVLFGCSSGGAATNRRLSRLHLAPSRFHQQLLLCRFWPHQTSKKGEQWLCGIGRRRLLSSAVVDFHWIAPVVSAKKQPGLAYRFWVKIRATLRPPTYLLLARFYSSFRIKDSQRAGQEIGQRKEPPWRYRRTAAGLVDPPKTPRPLHTSLSLDLNHLTSLLVFPRPRQP